MTRPLQPGDPTALGPFQVDARLADAQGGVVFLGSDAEGRRAAIAALVGPAAEDPAMQERFREVADPGELYSKGIGVLAADFEGATPWVATAYDAVRPGAERVIEELATRDATARYFQPFTQYPAETGYVPSKQGPSRPRRSGWWWLVVGILLLALLLLLLVFLAKCGGGPGPQPSGTSTSTVTTTGSGTGSQSPTRSQSASQSASNSQSRSQSHSPSSRQPSRTRTRSGTPTPGGSSLPTGRPVDYP
ncbi:MAG: hypothetical protein ACRDMV_14710 [Streptosporangiales bacterium]